MNFNTITTCTKYLQHLHAYHQLPNTDLVAKLPKEPFSKSCFTFIFSVFDIKLYMAILILG
ncbi:hypothetical protein Hanom_Chr12g01075621 [Helianthus anomalus]